MERFLGNLLDSSSRLRSFARSCRALSEIAARACSPLTHGLLRSRSFAMRSLQFLSAYFLVQAISTISGVLLVRWLSVNDYAAYTMTNVIVGAIAVLTKGGGHLGFTAIVGRYWPDKNRIASAVGAIRATRRLLSMLTLPPLLLSSTYLLKRFDDGLLQTVFLIAWVLCQWYADLKVRGVDALFGFAKQTTKPQILDGLLASIRLALVLFLYYRGILNVVSATGLIVLTSAMRAAFLTRWIRGLLPEEPVDVLPQDLKEIRTATFRQMPVEIYNLIQWQFIPFILSVYGSTFNVAAYGALGRISQLMVAFQALNGAVCVPLFCQKNSHVLVYLGLFTSISTIPCIILVVIAWRFPEVFLFFLGENYSNLREELLISIVVATLSTSIGALWGLVAHRGLNHLVWVQIPVGIVWCFVAPLILDLSSISGALWFQSGFSFALLTATLAELILARRLKKI